MSSAKDKYLESARKFIVKGQIDRAIKDYEQIVALDPLDMKHRQKLAELLVRMNRAEAAVKEYEAIGKYYADNSYYLKAIAVYKQIQKLTPDDITISLKLAEFNRKQGLTGNALAEYGTALDHYHKSGESNEVLNVLGKMIEVDPDNSAILSRYAESRYAAGLHQEAFEDFSRLALQLMRRGDKQSFAGLCQRVQKLFPEQGGFILEMLAAQIDSGNVTHALPWLQELVKRDPHNLAAWQLLVVGCRKSGNNRELKQVFNYMIHFFPDELLPRESIVQRAIDEKDIPSGTDMLRNHLGWFVQQGHVAVAERLCRALLDLAPGDGKLLTMLKGLAATDGDDARAEEAGAITGIADVASPRPEPVAEKSPKAAPTPAPPVQPLEETEDTWEYEIDLSMVDQLADGQPDELTDAFPETAGDTGWVDVSAATEEDEVVELESELVEAEVETAGAVGNEPAEITEFPADVPDFDPIDFSDLFGEGTGDSEVDFEKEALGWLADATPDPPIGARDVSLFTEEDLPSLSEFSSALDTLFSDELMPPPRGQSDIHPPHAATIFPQAAEGVPVEADSETHYDLGIAYKEMGLLDEALKELQIAGRDPVRTVDCLTLKGMCLREKGDLAAARQSFESVVTMKDATTEELTSAKYELALVCEAEGKGGEAERLYLEVQKLMPGFRDVTTRLKALQAE